MPDRRFLRPALWFAYAFAQGTVATGMWVVAHECGHGAFSDNKVLQDAVGYVLHSLLLVPYFSWQRSHAVHHSRTNHLTEGETHCPPVKGETLSGHLVAAHRFLLGELGVGVYQLVTHLLLGWPLYLLAGATGGPSRGVTNHFVPWSDSLFPGFRWKFKVLVSDVGVAATLYLLKLWAEATSWREVGLLYFGPYLGVNFWLVLYTWLQHTDVDVPHLDASEWTWERGAFLTIDRPYGPVLDFCTIASGPPTPRTTCVRASRTIARRRRRAQSPPRFPTTTSAIPPQSRRRCGAWRRSARR